LQPKREEVKGKGTLIQVFDAKNNTSRSANEVDLMNIPEILVEIKMF
jgi:hypothetical protein